MTGGHANIVRAEATTPFPYPLMSYVDDDGVRASRFAAPVLGVPEGVEVVVERLGGLVAAVVAIHADQFPS